ncbi:hypothetical protein CC85DRAFT_291709 [Cutaneotrichosporon oleaginosum]|uniref:Tcp11-domain-containing protein n=1 Tax=Cutaneotrichosporon oleaginosum TaxID=879819 RepID=A0A0J1B5U5_9TREE|nr:uncharacterized protein CC85DRAFT_291709 [Cutaneotrichosporon oleaginosum]KLT43084.1 hypothetical protein CC85DRAFT_291709 [Cutaneotrichosporon oleaginosum]TXT10014.1 hypothetical protein COLE_03948 [Cutaneotrichosporon oleaginosum]
MDSDPNAYVDRGSSFGPSRTSAPGGHRNSPPSQESTLVEYRDPRSAAHGSPKMGTSSGSPPSPKLAPSPSIAQVPSCSPHGDSSVQAVARHAPSSTTSQVEPSIFAAFASPSAVDSIATRMGIGSNIPLTSADPLQQILRDDDIVPAAPKHTDMATSAPSPEEPELLTCKPLDRVASQMGNAGNVSSAAVLSQTPPSSQHRGVETEWAHHAQQKPMERIVSQAGWTPSLPFHPSASLKRFRSMSDPPETNRSHSVRLARSAAKYYRAAPRKRMRNWSIKDAVDQAEGDRIMRQIRGRAQDNFFPAAREPPVNMSSLKILDTSEVLRLPQMRHELLFENISFLPVRPPAHSPSTSYALLSTHRSQIVDPSPATEEFDRYWACIRAEIEQGCRCTRWDGPGSTASIKGCICGRWTPGLSEAKWWRESRAVWPSRLPTLIKTLRDIFESLMASTTPCSTPSPHGHPTESPAYPPSSVTHSLVPALFAALDPKFLTLQVRRGTFDPDLFRVIGEAMKVHCAPVRDAMVDEMVAIATGSSEHTPDIVMGLRKCFDCVEVMKLDIANHQVQSLKNLLWQQAEHNEMGTFLNYLAAAKRSLESSKTFAWIHAASKRVAIAAMPQERRHLMAQCACGVNSELAIRSLADGFIDLVYGDWVEDTEVWPPIVPSRRPELPPPLRVLPSKVVVPEVFKMDACRIKNFHAEMVDIAIAQCVLSTFRSHYVKAHPNASEGEVADQVAQVRETYKHIMTVGSGLMGGQAGHPSDISLHMAHRVVSGRLWPETKPSDPHQHFVNRLAREFDAIIGRGIANRSSPMYRASLASLRQLTQLMLTNTLLLHRVQPESFLYDLSNFDSRPCTQSVREPVAPRLRVNSRRFVTLTEPLTGQGASTSDPRERYHRPQSPSIEAAHRLFMDTLEAGRANEAALAAELGFKPLLYEIRAVVDRMVKTADFNLCVFINLYGRKGMLVGSGKLQPLPELS